VADVRLETPEPAPPDARPPRPPAGEASPAIRLTEGLSLALSLAVGALLFLLAFLYLGPDSVGPPSFGSDSAVPVLMSNETRWDLFHAYYFAQDRFGAWPFLLAHGLAQLLGRPVTPEFLHAESTAFVALGSIPAMLLCRRRPALGLLAYAIAVLAPPGRFLLFELAQVYPWQLPLLLWAYWAIRHAWAAAAGRAEMAWLGASCGLFFLATWTSSLSGPLLLAVTVVEGFNQEARPSPRPLRRWLLLLLPSGVGMGGEAALRLAYSRFVERQFHRDFRTDMRIDLGQAAQGARMALDRLSFPLVLVSLLVLTATSGFLLVEGLRRRSRPLRFCALECTLLGAFLLAVVPLPALTVLHHVRVNLYDYRYFTPTYVFSLYGGLLAVAAWLPSRLFHRARTRGLLPGTVVLSCLALLRAPHKATSPFYAPLRATALTLASRAPGAVLLDGYWGTYVFAALAPPGSLLPLPRTGDWNRWPLVEAALASAPLVLVGHLALLPPEAGSEPRFLYQYGTLLERQEATFFSDGTYRFSSYVPRAVVQLAEERPQNPEGAALGDAPREVTLRTAGAVRDTAAVVEVPCRGAPASAEAWAEGASGQRLAVRMERVPAALFLFPPEDTPIRALHLSVGGRGCRFRGSRWYVRPKEA
jgi:hypothetical protein